MTKEDVGFGIFLSALVFCTLAFFLGLLCGSGSKQLEMQKEAVKRGHAEYFLDENYNKQRRWKEFENE